MKALPEITRANVLGKVKMLYYGIKIRTIFLGTDKQKWGKDIAQGAIATIIFIHLLEHKTIILKIYHFN